MGLDMYLDKVYYVSDYNESPIPLNNINGLRVKKVVCEAIYWRKFNALHKWFVDNVQNGNDDCGTYKVSVESLTKLYNLVVKVLKSKDASLLPPTSGFFFGSTDIDEWYWEDLERTKNELRALLDDDDKKEDNLFCWFTYHSSW